MTIEEKAKAYDDAIERAKEQAEISEPRQKIVLGIFPELAESEDERIRKAIKSVISYNVGGNKIFGVSKEDMLAWLEKQAKQKPIIIPKFKVGDTITDDTKAYPHKKIEAIEDENYVVRCLYTNSHQYIPINTQDEYILVEQKPVEWSEEDEANIGRAVDIIDWLKSLRPQKMAENELEIARGEGYKQGKKDGLKEAWDTAKETQWKPSEEQIKALTHLFEGHLVGAKLIPKDYDNLKLLLEQLKAL